MVESSVTSVAPKYTGNMYVVNDTGLNINGNVKLSFPSSTSLKYAMNILDSGTDDGTFWFYFIIRHFR